MDYQNISTLNKHAYVIPLVKRKNREMLAQIPIDKPIKAIN